MRWMNDSGAFVPQRNAVRPDRRSTAGPTAGGYAHLHPVLHVWMCCAVVRRIHLRFQRSPSIHPSIHPRGSASCSPPAVGLACRKWGGACRRRGAPGKKPGQQARNFPCSAREPSTLSQSDTTSPFFQREPRTRDGGQGKEPNKKKKADDAGYAMWCCVVVVPPPAGARREEEDEEE